MKEKNKDGRLPLHLACANNAPVEVVAALLAAHPDGEAACVGGVVEGCDIGGVCFA